MEIENWIGWLQARIPELKKSHNAFWVKQALEGYSLEAEKKALNTSNVSVSLLEEFANYILHNANWSESYSENPWYSEKLDKEVSIRELVEVFLNSR
tara:strand:- start:833 stop:1123 length:291 start_codon:yes stop_codon:yes gene_type:complete